ncbi:class I SAM-dependent methyltransferase [Pseudonocardia sp. TRM90224]|uniref:class I SAM-dependent methyltransferase n=1 Tax=Pseudonocardia sp. TRM90224 TaxID=2812678 RepID=UPI001E570DE6|nr:SAM-dependent methyltransferase [Pseudonocardia sp. TRM90224]
MSNAFVLFREFLRAPTAVATVTASSEALVAEMLCRFPTTTEPVVVELGAGSGRLTDAVQRRLRGRGRHVAIELNPLLAERLAERHRGVDVVCADAGTLHEVLDARGIGPVDAVVSLLPWAAYRSAPIPRLVADVLAPDGTFTQVALSMFRWLPEARRHHADVLGAFDDVQMGPVVWGNLPPARVRFACTPKT